MKKAICQSCGMPLAELTDFGTNTDGTFSSSYCHFCFVDGKFTDEGITLVKKMENNINIALKMGMTAEEATKLAKRVLPTLDRWK